MRIILAALAAVALANTAQAEPVPLGDLVEQASGNDVSIIGELFTPRNLGQPFFIRPEGGTYYTADMAVPVDVLNRAKECGPMPTGPACQVAATAVTSWQRDSLILTITSITFLDE